MASLTKVLSDTVRVRGRVKSGAAATIGINDIVIADDTNNPGYVTIMGSADSEGDSDEIFLGMAISDSNETATVDGFVDFVAPYNTAWLELQMTADDGDDLIRASVGTKFRSAAGTKGAQTLDMDESTKGVFKMLDPHDNVFDTGNARTRVALKCEPWGTSSVAILK